MRIAITTQGDNLDARVDLRFGRAHAFVLYDTGTDEWSVLDNTQNLEAAQGAGIQAASAVAKAGVEAVLTGNCGPRAFATLSAASIAVHATVSGTVRDAIEAFKAGQLQVAAEANVEGHSGMS
ncbi:NifB/NifX family molybdenum-iron cluster-binding protein [bacterium]|nr:NifB/NifX family molybdenum-iron cluster-binding protein [bacterium]